MISQVLTFSGDVNVSLQVGDVIYYSPTGTTGGFNTVNNTGSIVRFGICTAIYNNGNTSLSIPKHSIVVLYDNTNASTPIPAVNDYIMFGKNKEVNSSSLIGYYAEVTLDNYDTDKVELFSVSAEVSESSK